MQAAQRMARLYLFFRKICAGKIRAINNLKMNYTRGGWKILLLNPGNNPNELFCVGDIVLPQKVAANKPSLILEKKSSDLSFVVFWEEDCCASVFASFDCFSQSQVVVMMLLK
jgi:hypothetical protein